MSPGPLADTPKTTPRESPMRKTKPDPKRTGKSKRSAPARTTHKKKKKKTSRTTKSAPATLGIEEAWRYVDRFCRALWNKRMNGEQPASLAEIITTLRDQQLLPAHEANMMHTIRSLRNMLVHENVRFGEDEKVIVRAAWQIIRRWADRKERQAWQLTVDVCRARAA